MSNFKGIAKEIIEQLGGNKFIAMTGAKDFLIGDESASNPKFWLRMTLVRNKANVNRLKIYYRSDDTYDMKFYFQSISQKTLDVTIKNEKFFERIYGDQLQEIFKSVTGLDTYL